MQTIKPIILAFIGVRILALYVLWQGVVSAFPLIVSLVAAGWPLEPLPSALQLSYMVVFLVGFLVFWFGAGFISRRIIDRVEKISETDVWAFRPVLEVALTILGFVLISTSIPQLISILVGPGIEAGWRYSDHAMDLVEKTTQLGVGLFCLLGFRAISAFVVRLREIRLIND